MGHAHWYIRYAMRERVGSVVRRIDPDSWDWDADWIVGHGMLFSGGIAWLISWGIIQLIAVCS